MKKVTFLSRLFVTGITEPTNIISIGDPGEDIPIFGCEHKRMLRLEFDDIEEQISPEYRLFSHSDAGKVLRFIAECGDEDILVHCHAGISRSAAVAMFMNERLGYFLDL
ncbi:MAG: hypothetical protein RSG77_26740, partial [Hafnia sp.]